jgi:hypothetical protein
VLASSVATQASLEVWPGNSRNLRSYLAKLALEVLTKHQSDRNPTTPSGRRLSVRMGFAPKTVRGRILTCFNSFFMNLPTVSNLFVLGLILTSK